MTVYNDRMSETHERGARTSFGRIIGAAVGAAIVLFGALWLASPILILGGMGPGSKWEHDQSYLTPVPYLGLFPIGIGLIVIWTVLFDRRPGEDRGSDR